MLNFIMQKKKSNFWKNIFFCFAVTESINLFKLLKFFNQLKTGVISNKYEKFLKI